MTMDIRCDHKKFAELTEDSIIEVKCSSRFCGAGTGVVVIHRFDALSGERLPDKRFRDPGLNPNREVSDDATDVTPLRSA